MAKVSRSFLGLVGILVMGLGARNAHALTAVRQVIPMGPYANCVVTTDGRAICWGYNYYRIAGMDLPQIVTTPTEVPLPGKIIDMVSVFNTNACVLVESGDVYCWGGNSSSGYYPFGFNGTNSTYYLPPIRIGLPNAAGSLSLQWERSSSSRYSRYCANLVDGRTFCWGRTPLTEVPGAKGAGALAQMIPGFCGLQTTGELFCNADYAKLESGAAPGLNDPTEIFPGQKFKSFAVGDPTSNYYGSHYCAVSINGEMNCRGLKYGIDLNAKIDVSEDWAWVESYGNLECGVTEFGNLFCWGGNARQFTGVNKYTGKPAYIPSGEKVAQVVGNVVLYKNGLIKVVGDNAYGQLGNGTVGGFWGDTPDETLEAAPYLQLP